MEITFLGVRGSCPISRSSQFGISTIATRINTAEGGILYLDGGTGLTLGELDASPGQRCSLVLSHVHWDHIMGIPFFSPLYVDGWQVDIYEPESSAPVLNTLFDRVHFPLSPKDLPATVCCHTYTPGETIQVEGLRIETVPLPHPGGSCGMRLHENNRCVAFSCDCEINGKEQLADILLDNASLAVVDASYGDAEYRARRVGWGHSSREVWLPLAARHHIPRLFMQHHSPEHTDDQLFAAQEHIRARGLQLGIDVQLLREGQVVQL